MPLLLPNTLKPFQCVTVPVDIKQSKDYLPTLSCAPINAAAVTDDRATFCRGISKDGGDVYSIRFKSELAGPFGAGVSSDYKMWQNEKSWVMAPYKAMGMIVAKLESPDAYSKYAFWVTPETLSLMRSRSSASKMPEGVYAVDSAERATLMVASAFACWGYHAENSELIQFANALNAVRLTTLGAELPTGDRIDHQKGESLPQRDLMALTTQPHYESVPVLGTATRVGSSLPGLPVVAKPFMIPVDVKANDVFPVNMNFSPLNADVVMNDRALLTSTSSELCVRFKSEVGGLLGGLVVGNHLPQAAAGEELFSPYALCVNSASQVYARNVADNKQYKVDMLDRAILILASALGAAAYTQNDFYLKQVAEGIYAARNSMTSVGIDLPRNDRLQDQTKVAYAASDVYLQNSEMVSDYCIPSSPNYSLWMCAAAGMGSPSL